MRRVYLCLFLSFLCNFLIEFSYIIHLLCRPFAYESNGNFKKNYFVLISSFDVKFLIHIKILVEKYCNSSVICVHSQVYNLRETFLCGALHYGMDESVPGNMTNQLKSSLCIIKLLYEKQEIKYIGYSLRNVILHYLTGVGNYTFLLKSFRTSFICDSLYRDDSLHRY